MPTSTKQPPCMLSIKHRNFVIQRFASGIFVGVNLRAREFFRALSACRAKFSLSKSHRDLKKLIFSRKFANTFLLLQRTVAKKKIWNNILFNIFLYAPKMGKNGFAHGFFGVSGKILDGHAPS